MSVIGWLKHHICQSINSPWIYISATAKWVVTFLHICILIWVKTLCILESRISKFCIRKPFDFGSSNSTRKIRWQPFSRLKLVVSPVLVLLELVALVNWFYKQAALYYFTDDIIKSEEVNFWIKETMIKKQSSTNGINHLPTRLFEPFYIFGTCSYQPFFWQWASKPINHFMNLYIRRYSLCRIWPFLDQPRPFELLLPFD